MYIDKLVSLYLNKSKLNLYDSNGELLSYEAEVGEHCKVSSGEYSGVSYPFTPDFELRGILVNNKRGNPRFYITSTGSAILYITGVNPNSLLNPFRVKEPLFSSYWEQKQTGYLFQVVRINTIQNENTRILHRKVQA